MRRLHLPDAPTWVFGERGYSRATMRDIAREAGVAEGTIDNVFDSMEALLRGDPLAEAEGGDETPFKADPRTLLEGRSGDGGRLSTC